jgi:hypothetical protein
MSMSDLKSTLNEIREETRRMTQAALDESGDPAVRAERARELDEQLQATREELEAAGPERDQLEAVWSAIERDLIFLQFDAGQDEGEESPAGDTVARALAINREAFELAKGVIHGRIDQQERQDRVRELDDRMQGLVGLPGQDSPEAQHALSEADLDLTFAYEGGKGAMSLRVQRYLEEIGRG